MNVVIECPLCISYKVELYHTDAVREYFRCEQCELIFVPYKFHLSQKAEKREYDLHENSPSDQGYLNFLSRMTNPLLSRIKKGSKGLDFGCGPGPALSGMLFEKGMEVELYDPFYHPDTSVLESKYDFVTATEVVEHFREPEESFALLFALLGKGGVLGVMTKLTQDKSRFASWHYIRDKTHVCFYGKKTFEYISQKFGAEVEFVGDDVVFLTKHF